MRRCNVHLFRTSQGSTGSPLQQRARSDCVSRSFSPADCGDALCCGSTLQSDTERTKAGDGRSATKEGFSRLLFAVCQVFGSAQSAVRLISGTAPFHTRCRLFKAAAGIQRRKRKGGPKFWREKLAPKPGAFALSSLPPALRERAGRRRRRAGHWGRAAARPTRAAAAGGSAGVASRAAQRTASEASAVASMRLSRSRVRPLSGNLLAGPFYRSLRGAEKTGEGKKRARNRQAVQGRAKWTTRVDNLIIDRRLYRYKAGSTGAA